MTEELIPTLILKGKAAKRFYENINNGKISEKQQAFLDECVEQYKEMTGKDMPTTKEDILKCPTCGKSWILAYDSIAKKVTGCIYKPDCDCYDNKGIRISVG